MTDMDSYFHDDTFHFGFDELATSCWSGSHFDDFMKAHDIQNKTGLREYYRK